MGTLWISERDEQRFLVARSGDFLHFPFQCDCCWFRNLKFRDPADNSEADRRLLKYIRRVDLDGMWSREPATVRSIRLNLNKTIKYCLELSVEPTLPNLGPWPIGIFNQNKRFSNSGTCQGQPPPPQTYQENEDPRNQASRQQRRKLV